MLVSCDWKQLQGPFSETFSCHDDHHIAGPFHGIGESRENGNFSSLRVGFFLGSARMARRVGERHKQSATRLNLSIPVRLTASAVVVPEGTPANHGARFTARTAPLET